MLDSFLHTLDPPNESLMIFPARCDSLIGRNQEAMKKRREEAKKRSKAEAPELNSAAEYPRDTLPGSCNASAEEASSQS